MAPKLIVEVKRFELSKPSRCERDALPGELRPHALFILLKTPIKYNKQIYSQGFSIHPP